MLRNVIYLALAALGAGTAAHAQDFSGAEPMLRGDLPAAEREIQHQRRMFPTDPDLLLNLARVYAQTQRTPQAAQLYREVLARPDEALSLAGGRTANAHAIAQAGLRQISLSTLATR
jgi:Flp pilus assembly protein TadD